MANAVTSKTSPVAAGVVTHRVGGVKDGVHCYLKYAKGDGTSVSVAFTFIAPDVSATDEYQPVYLSAPTVPAVQTYGFSADGNYRLPVPMASCEKIVKATVTFADGTTQTLVVNFRGQ
jgi:hypothetical protein